MSSFDTHNHPNPRFNTEFLVGEADLSNNSKGFTLIQLNAFANLQVHDRKIIQTIVQHIISNCQTPGITSHHVAHA